MMIKIKNLSFAYGKTGIFKDFNLEVPDGEVALITGINGVGKSTLLRLLAGVLRPDGGEIDFGPALGPDPRRFIGFISDAPSLYESMKVSQAIEFHQSVYGIDDYDDRLIKRTKIDREKKISQLSMGQRVIFHLSLILSSSPKVLLIDEVIHTIDVFLRGIFLRELIALLSERSITVVFVNLNFRDIENMVDRVILLKDGEVAVDEKIDDLKSKVKKIVGRDLNNNLPVLFQVDFVDYSDYYIYPFSEEAAAVVGGDVVDLDLTAIVNAFIGGEYV
jgi:ABC-2 type transport system ATP-binding protein